VQKEDGPPASLQKPHVHVLAPPGIPANISGTPSLAASATQIRAQASLPSQIAPPPGIVYTGHGPIRHGSTEPREPIWNKIERRKVVGPIKKNLEAYLFINPECEPYRGQDKTRAPIQSDILPPPPGLVYATPIYGSVPARASGGSIVHGGLPPQSEYAKRTQALQAPGLPGGTGVTMIGPGESRGIRNLIPPKPKMPTPTMVD